MIIVKFSRPNTNTTVATTRMIIAWVSLSGGRMPSDGSDSEPVRQTNDRIATQKAIMDHPSHIAGAARRTQIFHQMKVVVLCASYNETIQ